MGPSGAGANLSMTVRLLPSRLTLRHSEDADREPYAELTSDSVVVRYLTPLGTREASDAWIDRQTAQFAEQGFGYWAVDLREARQFVGAVGLSRVT